MNQISLDQKINFEETDCLRHKGYYRNIIHVKKQAESNLICLKCVQQRKISNSEMFNISDIINLTEDSIIPNFPPLEDETIKLFLNDLEAQQWRIDQMIQNINTFFDTFKTQFLLSLQQIQNQTKLKISALIELKQEIKDIYNEISSKELFQQALIENKNDISVSIKQIIEEKFENITVNTLKIKDRVDQYKLQLDNFNLSGPEQIQETVLNMIGNIGLFEEVNISKIINDQLGKRQIQVFQQVQSIINMIEDLIKNSQNYSAETLFSQINQTFEKCQHIKIEAQYQSDINVKEKEYNYGKQTLNCLKDINDIVIQIQSLQKEYINRNNNKNLQVNGIQLNSQCFIDLLSYKFDVNLNKLEILQEKYGTINFDKNQIHKMNFIKSRYEDSSNLKIVRIINNFIEISKLFQAKNALSYTDFILDPKKKYIFRIQLITEASTPQICFGIVKDKDKDANIFQNGLTYYTSRYIKGITKIIKGDKLYQEGPENINKQFEVRIHLENKSLKMADYPNYKNVSELEDITIIDSDSDYRFAIQILHVKQKIIIKQISIVEEFDNKM